MPDSDGRIRRFIKSLPQAVEFAIVVLVAFGPSVFTSIKIAVHQPAHAVHSAAGLPVLIFYEVALIAILSAFLWARGWSLEKIGLIPTFRDTGIGILLWVAAYAVWAFIWYATAAISPNTIWGMVNASAKIIAPGIPLTTAIVVSLVNPVFEEVFVSGYVISVLRRPNAPLLAVNASVALRLLYHLYQGVFGILSVIPIGLIFAYWYARTGRLWPLIVAHAIMDMIGFLPHVKF